MDQEAIISRLEHIVQVFEKPSSQVKSIVLLGSYGTVRADLASDIDILIITKGRISFDAASELGEALLSVPQMDTDSAFVFHNPVCERCSLVQNYKTKYHLIVHSWDALQNWVKNKDYIVCMWSQNYSVLSGEDPFNSPIKPNLNQSLLDEWDGMPGFQRQIKYILLTKDPSLSKFEYSRYIRFFQHRAKELAYWFPELHRNMIAPDGSASGRSGLAELGMYFENIEKRIRKRLT